MGFQAWARITLQVIPQILLEETVPPLSEVNASFDSYYLIVIFEEVNEKRHTKKLPISQSKGQMTCENSNK